MRLLLQDGQTANEAGFTAADLAKLLHSAGADPSAASADWVAGHVRWLVWKLARWETALPRLAGRLLTVPVVLDQLAHRSVIHSLLCLSSDRLTFVLHATFAQKLVFRHAMCYPRSYTNSACNTSRRSPHTGHAFRGITTGPSL